MERMLEEIARQVRITAFKAISEAGGGHFGGTLSIIELLTALYFSELKVSPQNPLMEGRDRFILSKGHSGPGLYTVLAMKGFFPLEKLKELDKSGGMLPKHVDRHKVPGVDVSAGALGQGLSIGTGMALGAKAEKTSIRVYVMMGDGECNEGQVWEAAMTASKYKLDNLLAIVDFNNLQIDGCADDIMPVEPFDKKWESFGWNVLKIDGHNLNQILTSFKIAREAKGKPTVIIAKTVKGKGVSFMENNCGWHAGSITQEQYIRGLSELEGRIDNANG